MAEQAQTLRIMIVSDSKETVTLLEDRLTETPGYDLHIQSAREAETALDLMRSRFFEIVFIDYLIPGGNGLRLMEQMRQLHPKVAVVMLAARGSEKIAVESMKRGAIDFLSHDDLPLADVSQLLRRAVEMQILQTENVELRQVNRMKDEFISSVSHELRTPLAVILGYAKTLTDGGLGELTPPQLKALQAIQRRGEGLLQMINRLLAFKDSAFLTQEVLLRPTELRAVLKDLLDGEWPEKFPRGIRITRNLGETVLWSLADKDQLREVINSLLSNAVKFSPEDSAITVSLETRDGRENWIRVTDEGRGIQPEAMLHLFEGFAHTDSELTREVSGLGIGLAIARQIVELHGGRIWLESKGSGKGSTATVALPVSDADTPHISVERPQGMKKKRLLVVEDNADMVELVRLFLVGFSDTLQLTTAMRGDEALELLRERHFDLLVLDLMLPDMNGLELLDRVRLESKEKSTPVLILSGHPDAAKEGLARGAQDVLIKPFNKQQLLDKILNFLGMERRSRGR